jgi:hypothetical protein
VFYQRQVRLAVIPDGAGSRVCISGRSEYFPEAFRDELDDMAAALERRCRETDA